MNAATGVTATGVPVVDGIPFARAGRAELRDRVAGLLADGEVDRARVALFTDADDWWSEPPPPPDQLARVPAAATLREAMELLGMGRVGDYFAHRWWEPTHLAGLALLGNHWPGERPVVDVACGIGTQLRELSRRGVRDLLGLDVVWSKLWLAQRFVCPAARYVCADLTAAPDLQVPGPAYVTCHDAFYFLRDKPAAAAAMHALAGPGGTVVVGHAHVADTVSAGEPLVPAEYARLLGATVLYDDAELTAALLAGRAPRPAPAEELTGSEAIGLVAGDLRGPAPVDLGEPLGPLRPNPLYVDGELHWPSERYAAEYGPRSGHLPGRWPDPLPADAARRRLLVDLPEQW
ncbi:class I SAM-dependent methyltransferase [Modestobacter sp. VKM Ac-2979]|uniref:methyltransferase domain-containing protein n=1 Tax=unclassified Modestobacter TaxID=2643866 RepID=UPI0022AB6366|nr:MULTISPECIES: class I SAM-dependent methyltransferase [unclassified Modestobacter]MCZ2810559.1 class I SAM-dependent methyltransferase [Modestobacter sp. VKM Ac-2979]MCZ2842045.1 class I SAM-dependent methyltransferase [Modestobacter sp. VKM Ac-2980]